MRSKDLPPCNQQTNFLKGLFHERMRVDRRQWAESRRAKVDFNAETGVTIGQLGDTKVLCFIEAEIGTPRRTNRPGAGSIHFVMEILPMANPSSAAVGEAPATDNEVDECLTMLETLYRDSYCIDFDTLCIEMNRYVVDLKCSLKVLDRDGGLFDCSSLAVTTALSGFKRNDATYDAINKRLVVVGPSHRSRPLFCRIRQYPHFQHRPNEKQRIPLTLYHRPVTVTFGFIDGISEPLVDPAGVECPLLTGCLVIGANHRSEICMVSQSGNINVAPDVILKCSEFVIGYAKATTKLVEDAVAFKVQGRKRLA